MAEDEDEDEDEEGQATLPFILCTTNNTMRLFKKVSKLILLIEHHLTAICAVIEQDPTCAD